MSCELTVVMTHWKRPHCFAKVLDAVLSQTIPLQVFLWDNSAEGISDERISWRVHSSQNQLCWPRWFMAAQANTEFVANIDDDLLMRDHEVLADAVEHLKTLSSNTIIGPFGRRIDNNKPFLYCPHVNPGQEDIPVDIVKGRLMIMRTAALREALPMRPDVNDPLVGKCDDIAVCSYLANQRREQHVVPSLFKKRFEDLPQRHALCLQPGFYELRGQAARRFFPCDEEVST